MLPSNCECPPFVLASESPEPRRKSKSGKAIHNSTPRKPQGSGYREHRLLSSKSSASTCQADAECLLVRSFEAKQPILRFEFTPIHRDRIRHGIKLAPECLPRRRKRLPFHRKPQEYKRTQGNVPQAPPRIRRNVACFPRNHVAPTDSWASSASAAIVATAAAVSWRTLASSIIDADL
jgi:hypothetical protein